MLTIGLQGCATQAYSTSSHAEPIATMTDMPASATLDMNFWETLSTLETQLPFTQQKIEHLLHTTLTDTPNKSNDLYDFLKGSPVNLKDGTSITNIKFSMKRDGTRPGDVRLKIDSPCILLKEVQSHYKNTRLTYLPRPEEGHNAKAGYSDFRPWGVLLFAFNFDIYNKKGVGCLADVIFQASYMSETIYMIESYIRDVRQKIEQGKWVDANIDAMSGLSWAGSDNPYASPDVLTKSKKQLELADQSGQLEKAVPLRLEVLQMRLADFKARYPKPNPR